MAFRSILQVVRPDHGPDEPEFVLVYVESKGRNDLDLKLIGTDESAVFTTSVKQSQTSLLKAKSNKSTAEEWDNILLKILLGNVPDGVQSAAQQGVEATAKAGSNSLTITIQKRIEGITQKLGTISLTTAKEEEIDFFDWCGKAVQAKDNSRLEYEKFKTTVLGKDAQIKKLEDALKELTTLKKDNETQLLEKFALLLNEKKSKIRNQQRLLSIATLNPERAEELDENRLATQSRDAGPSRIGKRKATEKAEPSDDESEDGFEKMAIDGPVTNESDQDGRNTSEDEATASEDEEAISPRPKRNSADAVNKKSPVHAKAPSATQDEPPPKRALPYATRPPVRPLTPQEDGSETESDDEL